MKKKRNELKFGNIKLSKNLTTSAYTPKGAKKFIDHGDILKVIATGVKNSMPVLLIGESGTGKTSAIRYLAELTNNGLRRVNLNGGTTADELVGRILINEKGTYWVDGILTEAMRNGEWIVLDEINAALPEVLFVLQSIMDDDGYLVLNEKDDKEIVHKHPNFRLFATCNPPEYAGTKEMNKALLSRFAICIYAEYPNKKKELEIINHHMGETAAMSELADRLVDMAESSRKDHEKGKTGHSINTRDVLNTMKLAETMEPFEAFQLAYINKLEKEDKQAMKASARLMLPITKREKGTISKIRTTSELEVGKTFQIDEDCSAVYVDIRNKTIENIKEILENNAAITLFEQDLQPATKGETFKTIGSWFMKHTEGINRELTIEEATEAGDRVASLVEFTTGPKKGKIAILPYIKEIKDTGNIINSISEKA